ncbi:MAG: hypothetical protein IPH72_32560 [Sandaracinaceae bacterium]|nr:hypothetical protein [Sandaracinaceae bacterium]
MSIRFQALHSCEAETVQSSESGYVITGCGIEAHYACLDADPFPLLTGSRMRCVETRVNDGSTQAPSRQAVVVRDTNEDAPHPSRQGPASLRANAEDEQNECAGDLWIDGERVTPHESVIDPVPGGALYSMLVDLTALDRMGTAQRIAARVCGVDEVLAGPAGRLARDLAIRAHEESSASQP